MKFTEVYGGYARDVELLFNEMQHPLSAITNLQTKK